MLRYRGIQNFLLTSNHTVHCAYHPGTYVSWSLALSRLTLSHLSCNVFRCSDYRSGVHLHTSVCVYLSAYISAKCNATVSKFNFICMFSYSVFYVSLNCTFTETCCLRVCACVHLCICLSVCACACMRLLNVLLLI